MSLTQYLRAILFRWRYRNLTPLQRELAALADSAMSEPEGVDVGPLTHEERNQLFFGLNKK